MSWIGAITDGKSCSFRVWAPLKKKVSVQIFNSTKEVVPMECDSEGYWTATVNGISGGTRYLYLLDDNLTRPDPASQSQPDGVHGPSMVVDHGNFLWNRCTTRLPELKDYIIYELHIGTYTEEGTFAAAIEKIPFLASLGITAIEIMPVAQFPGTMNWGYDGVYPFAVQDSYGGVNELKMFVNECHRWNIAVILDVVYNHLGPEGNYLRDFGPYFTDRYKTPWGESLNYDGPYSDHVSDYFIENALYWMKLFNIDALRLDAVHAICDMGARPFLQRLSKVIDTEFNQSEQQRYLIAESDLNDSRILNKRDCGGFGLHAQWNDDFHHSLHSVLTGECRGYYFDFGNVDHLIRVLTSNFCYSGQYSIHRKRTHGNDVSSFNTDKFVVCSQNHDQIGNRMLGERLLSITDIERARLAAALVILSPFIPLLFMGEEHAEENPFLYFADHSDEGLKDAVRKGRTNEFADFQDIGKPLDPFSIETFNKSKIDWSKRGSKKGSAMFLLYQSLIKIRREMPALRSCRRDQISISRNAGTECILIHYKYGSNHVACFFNLGKNCSSIEFGLPGTWIKKLDSEVVTSCDENKVQVVIETGETILNIAQYGFVVYELKSPQV
ncbi:MAG: malto-oligosyltrehalose trehalohydrolase [Chitinispirillaceae bacterium]|nr:malto-oligosyltrehalose trehalohydrolase [Chitinispirillaceae bacterium]